MRDPDLVQRAERASIVLEQAWERWREMHGLGAEPMPPVSSYVGYSLEEPWGQPRVVFGLRADEAELLAAQLDGHDCVGPLYAEVSARDWRRGVNGPASLPRSPYGDPFSVPPQGRPADADLIGPESVPDYAEGPRSERTQREFGFSDSARARRRAARKAGTEGRAPADVDERGGMDNTYWPDAGSESFGQSEVRASQTSMANSPPLAPLPPVIDFRPRPEQPPAESDAPETSSSSSAGTDRVAIPAQGAGYRGPRYRGFPPRYQAGVEQPAAEPEVVASIAEDEARDKARDEARDEAEPVAPETKPAARLSRPPRKRTKTVRPAEKPDESEEQPAADQAQ